MRLTLFCLKVAPSEAGVDVNTDGNSTECRIVPVMKIAYVVEHKKDNELMIEFVFDT